MLYTYWMTRLGWRPKWREVKRTVIFEEAGNIKETGVKKKKIKIKN